MTNHREERTPHDPKARAAEKRRSIEARIAVLLAGGTPKRLSDGKRLRAAAYLGSLVRRAGEAGLKTTEVCQRLGESAPFRKTADSAEPFRIHRWMLKGAATEVTDAVVDHHRGRAEPLRSTAVYLQLVEHLAGMSGADPVDCQAELLGVLDLAEAALSSEDMSDIVPEQKLAHRVQTYAAHMAMRLDLARLIQRGERAQAGWNMKSGPDEVVDLAAGTFEEAFLHNVAVQNQCWLETELPPLPSVRIARIPFGMLPGPFVLTSQKTATVRRVVEGQAVAYWDLHLSIGPTGPIGVGAMFVRATSVDLHLPDPEHAERTYTLRDLYDDVAQMTYGDPHLPSVDIDGPWQVELADPERARRGAAGEPCGLQYRSLKWHDPMDETPPSDAIPLARITPVSAASIRYWLMADLSLSCPQDGGRAETGAVAVPVIDLLATWEVPDATWIRRPCLARSLEVALQTGALDDAFLDWSQRFDSALTRFEVDWIGRVADKERKQDARWRDAAVGDDDA